MLAFGRRRPRPRLSFRSTSQAWLAHCGSGTAPWWKPASNGRPRERADSRRGRGGRSRPPNRWRPTRSPAGKQPRLHP
eukprot:11192165-Lingulodinium_polyedra.AAC.1